jgi:hypothetical protein
MQTTEYFGSTQADDISLWTVNALGDYVTPRTHGGFFDWKAIIITRIPLRVTVFHRGPLPPYRF